MLAGLGVSLTFFGSLVLVLGAALMSDKELSKDTALYAGATVSPVYRFALAARSDVLFGASMLTGGFLLQLTEAFLPIVKIGLGLPVTIGAILAAVWYLLRPYAIKRAERRFSAEVVSELE
jgi:hypothetical protein